MFGVLAPIVNQKPLYLRGFILNKAPVPSIWGPPPPPGGGVCVLLLNRSSPFWIWLGLIWW